MSRDEEIGEQNSRERTEKIIKNKDKTKEIENKSEEKIKVE